MTHVISAAVAKTPPLKIVIVGAVAGGASAAARARRLSEDSEILLIERGHEPSFANCGMPYYIGGEIAHREKLLVAPVQLLRERLKLDVRTRHECLSIDRARKTVRILEVDTGKEYVETYDRLILSPGAAPLRPPLPGVNLPRVHTLRNLSDADRLLAASKAGGRAVVVGGGFIGIEMVENLLRRGIKTTLLERNPQVLTPWDPEMVSAFAETLRDRGVDLRLGEEVTAFGELPCGISVETSAGDVLEADFVVLAIGVRPEDDLARAAGLAVAARGGIVTNPRMQTSDPDIYAVGDAVEVRHVVTKETTRIPLAGPANRQGRIAADACFGRTSTFRGVQGTAIVGLFDHTAAMTGLSEKACRAAGIAHEKIYVHPAHHAGYYPGAERISLKLVFDPQDGRVLGAQAVGGAGIDKRIDVIAMALQAGMTVFDLEEAELCYAPQFGSAKDPVNMAGFVAAGVVRGDQPIVHADQIEELVTAGAYVLDVRTPAEFARGAIPAAINIPMEELRARLQELPRERAIIAYCQVGMRGYLATRVLLQSGFDKVRNLSGGYTTYRQKFAAPMLVSPAAR
ncbi:FAD-dependent oxidoreductase [Botrimarina hoheduenensis]|uniref:Coenzyme A disulfide reductase n=1 Tax=Botrimarina hoheduenensis TaxID=2528000 RepID=A0A5C5VXL3_9BACT|nr:FAD-dependent oxidoreductase [Botrimarina hoheduenensis]TWT42735.1 Coenzyme A disulfide reductase [Botrimarina hoheduenensis]